VKKKLLKKRKFEEFSSLTKNLEYKKKNSDKIIDQVLFVSGKRERKKRRRKNQWSVFSSQ
jgi:hypothetical protein